MNDINSTNYQDICPKCCSTNTIRLFKIDHDQYNIRIRSQFTGSYLRCLDCADNQEYYHKFYEYKVGKIEDQK